MDWVGWGTGLCQRSPQQVAGICGKSKFSSIPVVCPGQRGEIRGTLMLGALEALGCFSGFSKVKSVLAIQLWKGWFSTQVIFACSWFALDVSGLLLCSAPSQADFNNNNTSVFLGASGPGPHQSSGHRGTQGFYAHTPHCGSFLPKPHCPHPKGAGSDELSSADLPPLPDCCLLDSAETKMPKLTGKPQAKPPCRGSRTVPLLCHSRAL